jgi:hypothetical protein
MLYWRTRLVRSTAGFWRALGRLESAVLREDIEGQTIETPIYIAGVPRAGSTLLTEILSRHPALTSHRYSDFPNIYTPFWRNWLAQRSRPRDMTAVERAHNDRIKITPESPEAVEEVIWMEFFRQLHALGEDQELTSQTSCPEFEQFYRDHIRKLLLVRKASRYLAKGNYNLTRIAYIHKLFPDARFIVPVRAPLNQVASLVKQDRLFRERGLQDRRVDEQLKASGHFEFGIGRRPVSIGNGESACRILDYWNAGRDVAGWGLYWASMYRYILELIDSQPQLKPRVLFVKYEELCERPSETLSRLFEHAGLDHVGAKAVISEFSRSISAPDYYAPNFSEEEIMELHETTFETASEMGYHQTIKAEQ